MYVSTKALVRGLNQILAWDSNPKIEPTDFGLVVTTQLRLHSTTRVELEGLGWQTVSETQFHLLAESAE